MNMFIIDNELYIRLSFFFGVFGLMAIWEATAPRRGLTTSKNARWLINLSVTFLNSLLVRLIFPLAAVGVALTGSQRQWGILNSVVIPDWAAGVIAVILLDLTIYLQHRLFHRIGLFWRLHMMHHTDLDIDVTTGARFHPIEILLSMVVKMAVVVLLGAPAWSVVVFEVLLNATSMFNHSNASMPAGIDRILRLFVVTPDMHRVHHSVIGRETNSNFGFNLPWWDRLLGTYRAQPEAGHEGMTIGLPKFRDEKELTLPKILALPFR